MLIKINKFVQVLFGYLLIGSFIEIFTRLVLGDNQGIFKMILFISFVFRYEVLPHLTSELNPFAFALEERWFKDKKRRWLNVRNYT